MTRAEKTAKELENVGRMVRLLKLNLRSDPVAQDPPAPDVLLALADNRRVGVEVTEVRDEDRAKAWNGTLQHFRRDLARRLAQENLSLSVLGSIHIENAPFLRRTAETTISAILKLAREWTTTGRDPSTSVLERSGLGFLQFVRFQAATVPAAHFGAVGQALGLYAVQGAIDRKREKLADYAGAAADEHWLLLVAGNAISGYVDASEVRGQQFESPFDRTIFLERSDDDCFDLITGRQRYVIDPTQIL